MIWLVGSLAYTALACTAARLMAGHLAWTFHAATENYRRGPSPTGDQWFGAWLLALLVALVWPMAILPWLLGKRVAVGAEADARLRERERRIADAERELGLR